MPVQCTGAMTGSAKLTLSSKDAKRLKLSSSHAEGDRRPLLGPAHRDGDAEAVLDDRQAPEGARAARRSVKLTLSVTMHDWGKPSTTTKKTITLSR